MLPKKNRADKKAIETIFKEGRVLNSSKLSFRFILRDKNIHQPVPKISIIVPKTVSKSAVGRNLLRRRGYNALKKQLDFFPASITGAFMFKQPMSSILEVEEEIKNILSKLK